MGKVFLFGALAVCVACTRSSGSGNVVPPAPDSGTTPDAGTYDAGTPDAGSDDGGTADGGSSSDGGTQIQFGGPGPWPATNEVYGYADGIMESPVVGTTTDETQNLWVATNNALYLLQPGQKTFKRFDGTAGLHLQNNPVAYCDTWAPNHECPIYGAASDPGIAEIVGGGPNEVFVGYWGHHDYSMQGDGEWTDPYRHSGQLDRVRLKADGTLEVTRFQMVSGNSVEFWHNRWPWRMIYDHFKHPHELYVGADHGVDKFSPDKYHDPAPGTWFNSPENNQSWMSDHLHPQACYHRTCDSTEQGLLLGDWRGLALDLNGDLWVAGRWAAGLIKYEADNTKWYDRGGASYLYAFGDNYGGGCSYNRPVFCVPQEGDAVNLSAVTVTPDGKAWFASGLIYGDSEPNYGVASFDGKDFAYFDPIRDIGMAEQNVRDMVALPDGRLVLAGPYTGLTIWDPVSRTHKTIRAGGGIPDDRVLRLELDTMVNPPALHVSTYGGAAVLRMLP